MLFYVKVHKAYSALRGVRRACGQRLYGDMQHLLRFLRRAAKMENSIRKTGFYINISEFGGKNDEKTLLAALLALVMLFGALPMSVFAEDLETGDEFSDTYEPESNEEPTEPGYDDLKDIQIRVQDKWLDAVGNCDGKYYSLIDGEWTASKNSDTTYAVTIQTAPYVEEYNQDVFYTNHVLNETGDTLTFTVEYANDSWALQGSTPVIKVKHEQEYRTYSLSYNLNYNGDSNIWYPITAPNTAAIRQNFTVDGRNLTRDGYILLGWADDKNATKPDYLVGGTITLTWKNPTKTIYAVWEEQTPSEIPDPTDSVKTQYVSMLCKDNTNHKISKRLENLPNDAWDVVWTPGSDEATLKLYPAKIAPLYTMGGAHKAVDESTVTVTLAYTNRWSIAGAIPAIPTIKITCAAPEIPDPTDSVKEQYVTVACDDQTAHPNIQYQLKNLPAGSVAVQWDRTATTAKLVLKPEKIAEHYGKSYGAHTAVNPADVVVPLTYANDAWSLSAAIPDVHVTCKPAQEIPSPKNSFDKLLVNVVCDTENSGHDPIEVPLTEVASSVEVQWELNTAVAYITLKPTAFAAYYSQHNNGAHDPVNPAAVKVEAHYDNEKGWTWTKPTINVKCEPVYTITYNWRGVVKPADVKNVNNPGTFTADELPITLKAPDFKNNEWPQKFLNWRDAEGNVVTQITEPGNVELYAYYQFPVKYTVYDENDQKVDNLSVTEWYNEDDFAAYSLRSGEQTGHDFDGWYQTTKDFGNTNKRVTKLNMAKKYELVGKLTRKEYTVTAALFLNGSEEAAKDARGVVISRSVKGLYGDLIDYPELEKQLKEAALAADAANKPNPDMADINICLNDKSGKPFAAETYGQEGYNWRNMQWPENNPTKKWIVAYAWAYVDTYYDVTFNVDMEGVTPVATQTVKCNATANEPTAPTKEGYKFLGWFEKDAAEPFDFTTPITKSMTLTAKWELNLQTVNVVIYRNGDMTKSFKTVALKKQPKGTVIDLSTIKIADYYEANSSGKYDFYGWYNDHKWNNYKANPENPPAGLDTITVNGWTNIICMVYDHEKVIVRAITDDDKTTETQLFSGMARRGSNLLDYLAEQNIDLEKVGHTHDEWYNYDSPQWKFGENDTIKGWTNVLVKYARKEYTVVAKMYLDGAPHFRQNTDFYTYQVTGLYGDPINFASIKAQAIAQAEKDRSASASYDASVIEDWAGNATCTTFGEHQPDLDTPHYVNVHVNTTQHVYVYRMIDGKMEPTEYHHSTAPFGANVVEHLNANVTNFDMPGYSHDEWFMKDVPALDVKFGDTDTINGWTNVVIKYTKNEFPVTYDYACTDPALEPNWKGWATLPENPYTYAPGESVRVAMMPDDVEDGEYIWKFVTWKLGSVDGVNVVPNAQVPMVEGGLTFVGIWERTQKEYGVTYSYDSSLPAEVQATIPKNPHTYTVGQMVTTAAKPDSVRVGEYIWTFKTWKLDGVEVAPNTQVPMVSGGLHFEGIWETKLIHYSLTIQYVDKKGKELAESHMDLLAKGEAYKVDSPKIKGYKLKNKVDAVIEGTMPGRNLTIEVVYIKKSTGGSSGTIDSPNKPTTKAPALTLNTDDHFAFINGYPDGSVQPEGNVTRAETAAILYRIMGDACQSYYKTNSSSYSDVARGDWYNTYVATLENAGVIVDTRTNGKFRPNDAITRAELASMIAQFAGLESASAAKFNDVGSRYWAAEEIAIAAKMGWINGYPDGSFRPDRNVTRAELMAMVNRALGRTPKSADDLLSGMKTWRDNANVNAWYYLDVQEATNDHTYTKSGTHETWKKLL